MILQLNIHILFQLVCLPDKNLAPFGQHKRPRSPDSQRQFYSTIKLMTAFTSTLKQFRLLKYQNGEQNRKFLYHLRKKKNALSSLCYLFITVINIIVHFYTTYELQLSQPTVWKILSRQQALPFRLLYVFQVLKYPLKRMGERERNAFICIWF